MHIKEQFLYTLFGTKVVKGGNNKKIDVNIEIKNRALAKHFSKLFTKYRIIYSNNKNEFLADCMYLANQAIENFEIEDGGCWEDMIAGIDKLNIARIITCIKTKVTNGIHDLCNDGHATTIGIVNEKGEKERVHAVMKFRMDSTDRLMSNCDDEYNLQFSEEQNFWREKDGSETVFTQWFEDNKDGILTNSQLELIDKLNSIQYFSAKDEMTNEELTQELDGMLARHIPSKLRKIEDRVDKHWSKARELHGKTFLEAELERQLKLVKSGLEIVNDEDNLEDMNSNFSNFIKIHIESAVFERILDRLECADVVAVNKAVQADAEIPSRILYRVATLLTIELEHLELKLENERFARAEVKQTKATPAPTTLKAPSTGKTIYVNIDTNGIMHQEN